MTFKLHSALIIQEVSDSNKNKWYKSSMISMIWLNSNDNTYAKNVLDLWNFRKILKEFLQIRWENYLSIINLNVFENTNSII